MATLICGSLAFDTITTFPGRFADQLLPDQLHILNVSFLVPQMRREFGGCAGNIAYTMQLLGGEPLVMATLGSDGQDYLARMGSWGTDLSCVRVEPQRLTAQAMIITDADNNQITAFHPGAMEDAGRHAIPARPDLRLGIIAPDGRDAMWNHAHQLADAHVPFLFDPGQGLPMFDGAALRAFVERATWVAVNDYEGRMLCDRMGTSIQALSRAPNLQGVIVTLGAHGCEVWCQGERQVAPPVAPQAVVDPTGCGDALRGALLFGLERGWPLVRCVELGNRLGSLKVAQRGAQNHQLDDATREFVGRQQRD